MRAYDSDKLEAALAAEHPCTDDNTCDIAKAAAIGCYLWAAHILSGATECPLTEAALDAAIEEMGGKAEYDRELELERKQLIAEPHLECNRCGAIVYTDENMDTCDNCGGDVVKPEEPEDPEEYHGCAATRAECQPEGDEPNTTPCSCSCHDNKEA